MPLATPPPPADSNRSHLVEGLIEKSIPEMPPPTWMTDELTNRLHGAFEATRTHALMALVKAGMITHEQAQEITPEQLFVAAFDLGVTVGQELEKELTFRRMMGEDL